jgi:hypothetical protein
LVLQKGGYFIGCSTLFRIDALQFSLALNDLQGIVNPAKAKGLGGLFGISYVFPLKKRDGEGVIRPEVDSSQSFAIQNNIMQPTNDQKYRQSDAHMPPTLCHC